MSAFVDIAIEGAPLQGQREPREPEASRASDGDAELLDAYSRAVMGVVDAVASGEKRNGEPPPC